MGAVRATPGGSNPTMSNRESREDGICCTRVGRESTPETPGPPGLVRRDPILLPLAGLRSMAMGISPSAGFLGSRGTITVAH